MPKLRVVSHRRKRRKQERDYIPLLHDFPLRWRLQFYKQIGALRG